MRMRSTLLSALATVFALSACGGQADQSEAGDEMAAEEAAMAAAPETATEAGQCYLRGATMEEAQTSRPSPLEMLEFSYQGGTGLLCYGAPSARGRTIMGELVPYGELWRMGANEATAIHLTGPVSIGGLALEPGSYSMYALPGEDEWEIFFNTNYQRWGIPISDEVRATEVGSVKVTPEPTEEMVETLTFRFEPTEDGTMGDLIMEWENTRLRTHLHPRG